MLAFAWVQEVTNVGDVPGPKALGGDSRGCLSWPTATEQPILLTVPSDMSRRQTSHSVCGTDRSLGHQDNVPNGRVVERKSREKICCAMDAINIFLDFLCYRRAHMEEGKTRDTIWPPPTSLPLRRRVNKEIQTVGIE